MKQLVIISGKGGTGKTSIAGAFVYIAGRCVVADCDVDAANLGLILSPILQKEIIFQGGKKAKIIPHLCRGSGKCYEICQFDAITPPARENNSFRPAIVDNLSCEGCGVCVRFCPEKAIEFNYIIAGKWFISKIVNGHLVHARLNPGESNSGKLVTLVRNKALELARENGYELILVDGPPGIGCPTIASLSGADLALIVTEPTFSGISDLERAIKLTEQFKIKTSVCVNKADINDGLTKSIIEFCSEKDLLFSGKIPYDEDVTEAMINGKSILEFSKMNPATTAITRIWRTLKESM